LHQRLVDLEKQHEYLQKEYSNCSELKIKYINDITRIRKENTKEFDNKMINLSKHDKTMKSLKKELFLIMNILKTRIVNIDTAEIENKIKGYIIDVDKFNMSYVEINKSEEPNKKAINYWNAMNDLLIEK
jgi:hypothetical protein